MEHRHQISGMCRDARSKFHNHKCAECETCDDCVIYQEVSARIFEIMDSKQKDHLKDSNPNQ